MKYTYLPKYLIFSCEHFSNHIPKEYKNLFLSQKEILSTHRAWDLGVPFLIDHLEKEWGEIPFKAEASRLLVDLNRSIGHKNLFSEFTKKLPNADRLALLDEFYYPYRDSFEDLIYHLDAAKNKPIIHIAIHSFTPIWEGELRNADIGLLFDPSHEPEKEFCIQWKERINYLFPEYKVRLNYPYKGKSNSLPTELRNKIKEKYIGIELEINQSFFSKNGLKVKDPRIMHCVSDSLKNIFDAAVK